MITRLMVDLESGEVQHGVVELKLIAPPDVVNFSDYVHT